MVGYFSTSTFCFGPHKFHCVVPHKFHLTMATFTYWSDLGIDPRLPCIVCACTMDSDWKPYTGRCGHTICEDCHYHKVVVAHPNDGEFQPCPFPGCNNNQSFELVQCQNDAILWLVEKIEKLKTKMDNYLCDLRRDQANELRKKDLTILQLRKTMDGMKKRSDQTCQLQKRELEFTIQNQADELQKKDLTILELRHTTDGMREYQTYLHNRVIQLQEEAKQDPLQVDWGIVEGKVKPRRQPPSSSESSFSQEEEEEEDETKEEANSATEKRPFKLNRVSLDGAWSKKKWLPQFKVEESEFGWCGDG